MLAGIYLLFLYERFFGANPLLPSLKEGGQILQNFVFTYYQYIPENRLSQINRFLVESKLTGLGEQVEKKEVVVNDENWKMFSLTVKKIYILSLLYCVFLLICSGMEKYIQPYRFQAMYFTVPIYILFLEITWQTRWKIRSIWWTLLFFCLSVVLFIFFDCLYNTLLPDNFKIDTYHFEKTIFITVGFCFFGLILTGLDLIVNRIRIGRLKKDILVMDDKISLRFQIYMARITGNTSELQNLTEKIGKNKEEITDIIQLIAGNELESGVAKVIDNYLPDKRSNVFCITITDCLADFAKELVLKVKRGIKR